MREEVERLLQRYADETTTTEEGGRQEQQDHRSIEVVAGATTQGVRGRPRLLFCGVVAGPFAHGLLLPHEPPPSPVEVYAVCVVPTESLLTIEAIDVNIKEWTLTHKQAGYSIRVDEIAKFCHLVLNANAMAVETLYAEAHCWQSDEWRDLKARYRDQLITDNTITKLLGPAKDHLTKKEKRRKQKEKQQRRKEEAERKQKAKAPKQTKDRSEERQQELAKIEETMRLRAEQRRKKAEERKERELAKQASGAGTTAETTTLPVTAAPRGEEPYNHVRLIFQANRILAGRDLVLDLEGDPAAQAERDLLLAIRRKSFKSGPDDDDKNESEEEEDESEARKKKNEDEDDVEKIDEEELMREMVCKVERAVEAKEGLAWKDGVDRPYNVPKTLLDPWIVALRRKGRFFWLHGRAPTEVSSE